MTILESIGLIYVIFTSALGTAVLGYFLWVGASLVRRQRVRGEAQEMIDVYKAVEEDYLLHGPRRAS